MAYIEFAELQGGPDNATGIGGEAPAPYRTGFTALEWQVIALAQGDSLSTLNTPNRVIHALEAVFGAKRANPELADPALEILRRTSVLARHRGFALPQYQINAFHEAGYSEDQLETLLGSVNAGRMARQQKAYA